MTSFVDFETKIILLPLPESKREVKIKDTKYSLTSIGDLVDKRDKIEGLLTFKEEEKEYKRYEDKTEEEIQAEMLHKRNKQMANMAYTRKWQFSLLGGSLFLYLGVYRKFLHPKAVMNSALQGDSLHLIRNNPIVQKELGKNFQMMMCNGKFWYGLSDCKFNMILFGK